MKVKASFLQNNIRQAGKIDVDEYGSTYQRADIQRPKSSYDDMLDENRNDQAAFGRNRIKDIQRPKSSYDEMLDENRNDQAAFGRNRIKDIQQPKSSYDEMLDENRNDQAAFGRNRIKKSLAQGNDNEDYENMPRKSNMAINRQKNNAEGDDRNKNIKYTNYDYLSGYIELQQNSQTQPTSISNENYSVNTRNNFDFLSPVKMSTPRSFPKQSDETKQSNDNFHEIESIFTKNERSIEKKQNADIKDRKILKRNNKASLDMIVEKEIRGSRANKNKSSFFVESQIERDFKNNKTSETIEAYNEDYVIKTKTTSQLQPRDRPSSKLSSSASPRRR